MQQVAQKSLADEIQEEYETDIVKDFMKGLLTQPDVQRYLHKNRVKLITEGVLIPVTDLQ